jgi:hypothetical protein
MCFIEFPASSPKTGADNPNDVVPPGESDRQDPFRYAAKAVVALLGLAVSHVTRYDTAGIEKCYLGFAEGHAMLSLIPGVLGRDPVESGCHD